MKLQHTHFSHVVHFLITMSVQSVLSSLFSCIQDNKECPFGDKCKYIHDVAEYMATKPADIGENCYLYDTFGKCVYGLSCRFAKAHTTPDFKSKVNAAVVEAYEGRTPVKNSLGKDLQNCLRKRAVPFKKSAEYLKTLSNNRDKAGPQGKGKRSEEVSARVMREADLSLMHFCRIGNGTHLK